MNHFNFNFLSPVNKKKSEDGDGDGDGVAHNQLNNSTSTVKKVMLNQNIR